MKGRFRARSIIIGLLGILGSVYVYFFTNDGYIPPWFLLIGIGVSLVFMFTH